MSVIGWSDASWACRLKGSSQGGYIIGVANKTFLEQAESPISVIQLLKSRLHWCLTLAECTMHLLEVNQLALA